MTELEIKQAKEIAELKKLLGLDVEDVIKENKKFYSFSKMTYSKLEECVSVKKRFDKTRFNIWFNFDYNISDVNINFLQNLIDTYGDFLDGFKEESLKALFVIPILNKVDFFLRDYECAGLYEEPLFYETQKFIWNGTTDFIVAKGLEKSEKPYFFIQEFKRNEENSFPRTQLLAELIAGLELNNWTTIKGCYIKGTIWNFMIVEKLGKDKYQYYISRNFDSTRLEDLKDIFRNLLYIKNEIIDMIKSEE